MAGGINLFVYAGNNPINYVDPYGLYNLYFGISGGTGLGWGHESYNGAGSYNYKEFNGRKRIESGSVLSTEHGRIWGAAAAAGPLFGFTKGDSSTLDGKGKSKGLLLIWLSIGFTYSEDGSWTGMWWGFGGKGWGLGYIDSETESHVSKWTDWGDPSATTECNQ